MIGGAEIYAAALPLADELVPHRDRRRRRGRHVLPATGTAARSRRPRATSTSRPTARASRSSRTGALGAAPARRARGVDPLLETRGSRTGSSAAGQSTSTPARSRGRTPTSTSRSGSTTCRGSPRCSGATAGVTHRTRRGRRDGYERDGVRLELTYLVRREDGRVVTPLRDVRGVVARGRFRRRRSRELRGRPCARSSDSTRSRAASRRRATIRTTREGPCGLRRPVRSRTVVASIRAA